MNDRLPPWSKTAEQSVLGSVLRDNTCLVDVQLHLPGAECFYTDAHQKLWRGILFLMNSAGKVDLTLLNSWICDNGLEQDTGGHAYLGQLWSEGSVSYAAEHYAKIVWEKYVLRRMIHICTEVIGDCYNNESPLEVLDKAEREILSISIQGGASETPAIGVFIKSAMDHADALQNGTPTGSLDYGFIDLDKQLGGMHKGELIVLGARPGIGKSALALAFASHAVLDAKIPVYFASLEMSGDELAGRMLCMTGRIDSHRWRTGKLTNQERGSLLEVSERIYDSKLFIGARQFTLQQVCASARRLYQREKIGLVIVDYLQLMETERERGQSRAEQVGKISRQLKLLAKDLEIPVLALSQLNRKPEERRTNEPNLADLRESGAVEQDADAVLLLYLSSADEENGHIVCKIAKQRHGPVGFVSLTFVKQFVRFENFALEPDYARY